MSCQIIENNSDQRVPYISYASRGLVEIYRDNRRLKLAKKTLIPTDAKSNKFVEHYKNV